MENKELKDTIIELEKALAVAMVGLKEIAEANIARPEILKSWAADSFRIADRIVSIDYENIYKGYMDEKI